ncbi:MAG TPA: prepilin-type N-terminal cleavage/methylation domain-containing protein, partial [Acidimicrobiales bacterium]|nr:prepilin-type N-terminal cleavage/methylation domain-containing protein [Acidimicrobiales bacterium]
MLNRPTFSLSHHSAPHRARFKSRAGEIGFTLVELVVCIAILGVVIIPLSATMLVGFRSTESSES